MLLKIRSIKRSEEKMLLKTKLVTEEEKVRDLTILPQFAFSEEIQGKEKDKRKRLGFDMEDLVGLLRIRVKRGMNLVSRDNRSSDPFVVITMGPQKLKTRGVENNCNPEWNDELTLGIRDPDQAVNLEVYDKDTFSSHDKMGDAEIDIKPFLEVQRMDLQQISDGAEIHRVMPNKDNCLSHESRIISSNGKIVQDMILRLRNVESGEVEIQIEWINVPNSNDL